MKQQDFDRLKAICEKEGFEIQDYWEGNLICIKKKDVWEGVEFAEIIDKSNGLVTEGKIYPIENMDGTSFTITNDLGESGGYVNKNYAKPSTEHAYIEQLKKEAFERFGEIREGDRFDRSNFSKHLGVEKITPVRGSFSYYKEDDILYYKNLTIYQSGKWATKMPKRIEVECNRHHWTGEPNGGYNFNFKFRVKNGAENTCMNKAGQFLAKQLESYLNNEL